ncbi:MAG: CotH kinase family protein [Bacteroidales bacterium]
MKQLVTIFFLCVTYVLHAQDVIINEVMYSNTSTITDAFTDNPDWIELYNPNDTAINIKNWQITDNTEKKTYWIFPECTIDPHSYLLVFASGRDTVISSEIHTDFKLAQMEEGVYLFDSHKNSIDSVPVQCVPRDYSLGYTQDGKGEKHILSPSPNTSNNNSDIIDIGTFKTSDISVSHTSGIYDSAFTIQINSSESESKIYYTLDGNEPDEDDMKYTEPISISNRIHESAEYADIETSSMWQKPRGEVYKGTVLRAVAYNSGCISSKVINRTFFVDSLFSNRYTVPVVSLITDKDNLFDTHEGIYVKGEDDNYSQRGGDWEREAFCEMFDTTNQLVLHQNIGIRIHGGASRAAPQKSIRLYARKKYGIPYFSYPFFSQKPDLQRFSNIILRSARDWSYVLFKDELCQSLVADMNIDNMATEPAVVFINGEYWGIHSFHERQDEHYIRNHYYPHEDEFEIIAYEASKGIETDAGSGLHYTHLINFIESHNIQDENTYNELCKMIDIPNLIDFFIAQLYFANSDFPKKNLKMWYTPDVDTAKWRYFFFDCDGCMIRSQYNHIDNYNNTWGILQEFPPFSQYILRQLFQNRDFRDLFSATLYYHLSYTFSPERVIEKIEEYKKIYKPLIAEHTLRWRLPEDITKWEHNVSMLSKFALQRHAVLIEELQDNFGLPFVLYPNPVQKQGICRVRFPDNYTRFAPANIGISIRATDGSQVYSNSIPVAALSSYTIPIDFNSGVYIVTWDYFNFQFTSKLIVH